MATSLLDLQALREAIEDTGVVIEILETFRMDARARLETLERACADRQTKTVARETHALKGMALSIGAMAMAQCCIELEPSARAGNSSALPPLLASLCACSEATLREIERELAAMNRTAA